MIVSELILKVTSCCNLNCQYCYVFNQGDTSYKQEPTVMNTDLITSIIQRIKEHCAKHQLKGFLVIFHGGEPLLASKEFFTDFVNIAKESLQGVEMRYGIQTNGTLLTQEWFTLLDKLDISIGVSLDGPYNASQYRVYRSTNENAYNEIIQGINIIHKNDFPVNVLSVINTSESPQSIYNHLKINNISSVDFLYPDITYDNRNTVDTPTGNWLVEMFDMWYDDADKNKPLIRYFDSIVGILVGVERGYEVLGRKENKTICIKPNGNIELVDNLKVCGNGFTKTTLNVLENTFDEALQLDLMKKYYYSHQDVVMCKKCKNCIIKDICGGGNLAHRYSTVNGFENPSAYCCDIFLLVSHIQNRLMNDLPKVFGNSSIRKLDLADLELVEQ